MARETKTVQCYPSDEKINAKIREYNAFGWELIGNQRCQEDESLGEGYYNTYTFHKLTFSREKTSPWYSEVVELEKKYYDLMSSEPICYGSSPSKRWLFFGIFGLIFGVLAFLALGAMFSPVSGSFVSVYSVAPALVLISVGIICLSIYIAKTKKYNKTYYEYYKANNEWKSTVKKEADDILEKADSIVNCL